MFATLPDVRLHYRLDGPDDAPWVTFITGIANDVSMWDVQAAALRDCFRVLRFDLRGQGRSTSTAAPYSMDLLAADVAGLWSSLGVRKSHLVGLGLGGSLALLVASEKRDVVKSLVACCCRARMTPEFAMLWHGLVDTVQHHGVEAIVENTAQRWFSDDFKRAHPDVLDGVRAMIRGTSGAGYLGVVAAFLALDVEDRLALIEAPTLLLGGALDRLGGPEAVMRELAAAIDGARYEAVPEAAHIANLQNPAGFNAALRSFLLQQEETR